MKINLDSIDLDSAELKSTAALTMRKQLESELEKRQRQAESQASGKPALDLWELVPEIKQAVLTLNTDTVMTSKDDAFAAMLYKARTILAKRYQSKITTSAGKSAKTSKA